MLECTVSEFKNPSVVQIYQSNTLPAWTDVMLGWVADVTSQVTWLLYIYARRERPEGTSTSLD
jgi:hypothetical protein